MRETEAEGERSIHIRKEYPQRKRKSTMKRNIHKEAYPQREGIYSLRSIYILLNKQRQHVDALLSDLSGGGAHLPP